MKSQTQCLILRAAAVLVLWSLGPGTLWAQAPAGTQWDLPNVANWSTIKHGKHLTIRVNPDADLSRYSRIAVGIIAYTGSLKKLKPQESDKLTSLLHDSLARDLSAAKLSPDSLATGSLILNAHITDVKRVHPWVNAVTIAAVFVPLDYGGANVTARVVDQQTGQIIAEIETVGCGQIYEVLASLQALGHSKLALKKDSRSIAKEVARMNWNQQRSNVNAAMSSEE
jgi:hypothetical protein